MTKIEKLVLLGIIVISLSIPIVAYFQAEMESRTFNKLTGAQTTWWDALWVELRVQEAPNYHK